MCLLLQDKCARYWPAQGSEGYGSVEVTLVHQTETSAYSESTISLRRTQGAEVSVCVCVCVCDSGEVSVCVCVM